MRLPRGQLSLRRSDLKEHNIQCRTSAWLQQRTGSAVRLGDRSHRCSRNSSKAADSCSWVFQLLNGTRSCCMKPSNCMEAACQLCPPSCRRLTMTSCMSSTGMDTSMLVFLRAMLVHASPLHTALDRAVFVHMCPCVDAASARHPGVSHNLQASLSRYEKPPEDGFGLESWWSKSVGMAGLNV